jgi:hypothetical protein
MARPSFKPTPQQRKEVHALSRICLPHDQIAEYLGLRCAKSLKKHFPKELQRGLSEAIAEGSRVCFEMAKSGKFPLVTTFWINTIGSAELKTANGDSVFKLRDYQDEPPPGREHEYVRTRAGDYMHETVIGPPARKPRVIAAATLKHGGKNNA